MEKLKQRDSIGEIEADENIVEDHDAGAPDASQSRCRQVESQRDRREARFVEEVLRLSDWLSVQFDLQCDPFASEAAICELGGCSVSYFLSRFEIDFGEGLELAKEPIRFSDQLRKMIGQRPAKG